VNDVYVSKMDGAIVHSTRGVDVVRIVGSNLGWTSSALARASAVIGPAVAEATEESIAVFGAPLQSQVVIAEIVYGRIDATATQLARDLEQDAADLGGRAVSYVPPVLVSDLLYNATERCSYYADADSIDC